MKPQGRSGINLSHALIEGLDWTGYLGYFYKSGPSILPHYSQATDKTSKCRVSDSGTSWGGWRRISSFETQNGIKPSTKAREPIATVAFAVGWRRPPSRLPPRSVKTALSLLRTLIFSSANWVGSKPEWFQRDPAAKSEMFGSKVLR
ncbi:hypothetical protein GX50_04406 [[Emmonsia] crescens]|uniref:Uncharacterized protein n=1 Tax=[Emmonsia] crescens TaxID=73230 RepID=A0A2B7ZGQ7_9EURO|nr:hypothetical protein GX50_04406 [Emmonsia crescens]